jgi:hypothetical protein
VMAPQHGATSHAGWKPVAVIWTQKPVS